MGCLFLNVILNGWYAFLLFSWLRNAREETVRWEEIGLTALLGGDAFVPVLLLRAFCWAYDLLGKGGA